jgi:O-antigen ligase
MLASVVAVAAILIVALDIPRLIAKRMNEEKHIVSMVMEGDLEEVPLTSIGIRVAIWRQAVNWIGERPLLGWGPKTREYLFESKALPDAIPRMGIRHFHNQILELAIAYGLVGILVFTGLFALVARAALRGWRDGRMPRAVLLFGVATFAFWVTVNMFESYFNYSTGAYINALLGGVLYTFRFTEARA